jgi:hypothetical protein
MLLLSAEMQQISHEQSGSREICSRDAADLSDAAELQREPQHCLILLFALGKIKKNNPVNDPVQLGCYIVPSALKLTKTFFLLKK